MRGLVETLSELLEKRGLSMAAAESCTGGMIAAVMTERPGASKTFECGFVTYSNAAKTAMLGVPDELLAAHGAVSEECARGMVAGALARSGAGIAVSVTGIAGPDGGTPEKPVGLVYIAAALRDSRSVCLENRFEGDRSDIRARSVECALRLLIELLEDHP